MNRLTIFGTGHAMTTKCYNTCFTLENDKGLMMVDGGGGNYTLTLAEKAGIDLADVHDRSAANGDNSVVVIEGRSREHFFEVRITDVLPEFSSKWLAEGKTEWMIANLKTGRLYPADGVFPPELEIDPDRVMPGPYMRMADDFSDADDFGSYTVRATDIDLGGHMNNTAYVRAIAGAFSSEEWNALDIREVEVAFRAPCFEGNALRIQRRRAGDALELRLSHEGKTIVLARIS